MPSLHHIALACRDPQATHHFYDEVLGFPLVYAEVDRDDKGGWFRHFFFDLGDGSCLAFFDLHGMGEPETYDTAISTGLGLPFWVNHVAIRVDAERVAAARSRLEAAGLKPEVELDHGWCRSLYVTDPNGILVELTVDTPGFEPDAGEARRILAAGHPDDLTGSPAPAPASAGATPPDGRGEAG